MINGVAQVSVYGSQQYAVRIQLDPNQLASRGIGMDQVQQALQQSNANLPTGTLQGADKALISGARVFDVYQGKGVPDGQKSVAIEVEIQPREKTLTDAEIEQLSGRIVAAAEKAVGAKLRG